MKWITKKSIVFTTILTSSCYSIVSILVFSYISIIVTSVAVGFCAFLLSDAVFMANIEDYL